MPIKDREMRRESESSEEQDQDQVQNGEDRKCPSHTVSNTEKKKRITVTLSRVASLLFGIVYSFG